MQPLPSQPPLSQPKDAATSITTTTIISKRCSHFHDNHHNHIQNIHPLSAQQPLSHPKDAATSMTTTTTASKRYIHFLHNHHYHIQKMQPCPSLLSRLIKNVQPLSSQPSHSKVGATAIILLLYWIIKPISITTITVTS